MPDSGDRPALTLDQWRSGKHGEPGLIRLGNDSLAVEAERSRDLFEMHIAGGLGLRIDGKLGALERKDCHALAALALYRQPFGFTRGDVRMLRNAGERAKHFPMLYLADRIAALLPPESGE